MLIRVQLEQGLWESDTRSYPVSVPIRCVTDLPWAKSTSLSHHHLMGKLVTLLLLFVVFDFGATSRSAEHTPDSKLRDHSYGISGMNLSQLHARQMPYLVYYQAPTLLTFAESSEKISQGA